MHIALQDKSTSCLMSVDLSIFSARLVNQSSIISLISAGINAIPQRRLMSEIIFCISFNTHYIKKIDIDNTIYL